MEVKIRLLFYQKKVVVGSTHFVTIYFLTRTRLRIYELANTQLSQLFLQSPLLFARNIMATCMQALVETVFFIEIVIE